jgi:hypothetical protein
MITALIASTLVFTAQASAEPELSLQQLTSMRCAAAFAIVAGRQEDGNSEALAYPVLSRRGKEFFVRTSAVLSSEAQTLRDEDTIADVMPGCLLLLDASGL